VNINIRAETAADLDAIGHVNRLAFGQDEEARLVDALRDGRYLRVSLVAEQAGQVVGHILFSDLPIITDAGIVPALALAPMAVLPAFQKQGIGSALVRKGLEECRQQGHKIVVVLGHPTFYPGSGFPRNWPRPWPHRSGAGIRGWRWSWCLGRWTAGPGQCSTRRRSGHSHSPPATLPTEGSR
jgi:putative acetyltransferase